MPVQIHLDDIKFNDSTDDFETFLTFNSKSYDFSICDFDKNDYGQAKALALKIKEWLENNLSKAKEYAASKLLKLKNENWLSEQEKPLSLSKFLETIEFDGILAFSEGSFEIYFNDHDLFGGHTIIVDISETFEFENANIAG